MFIALLVIYIAEHIGGEHDADILVASSEIKENRPDASPEVHSGQAAALDTARQATEIPPLPNPILLLLRSWGNYTMK